MGNGADGRSDVEADADADVEAMAARRGPKRGVPKYEARSRTRQAGQLWHSPILLRDYM